MNKLLFFFIFCGSLCHAQFRCQDLKSSNPGAILSASLDNSAKSDTIDILHYDLHLDFTEVDQSIIRGHCDIRFTPKMNNVQSINLDLLMLQIDSIRHDGQNISFTYNDTIIHAAFAGSMSTGDTGLLKVYYHGSPQGDGSGWGGWHQQNGYYYNLGVGFAANPHTYGRAWFPCFDNFVEKSTYDFHFITVKPLRPYANGLRISETNLNGDTILTHWEMTDPIPTYLASVAISDYAEINDSIVAMNGILPVQLMVKSADSINLLASFQNLDPAFHAFENSFGPYHWQKVGYAATTVGAMEHATSIHFPAHLIDGSLQGEGIMAHELAHHWWGNLLTCATDEDMWINEGMAEYSSHLYREELYGREDYLNTVLDNAYNVLAVAHINDDGFKAIQGLAHEYVYGTHVYQKGAMVGHNLRAYLGDSLFFNGLTTLLQNNKYGNITSSEFRDQLSQITGSPLNDFFDDWIFHPGFPQFSVDSFHAAANAADIKIGQRLRHAPAYYSNIPVFITFFSESGDTATRRISMNGAEQTGSFQNLPFTPAFALAGYSGDLLSGNTYDEYMINHTGIYASKYSKLRLTANAITDSAYVVVMHNWAGPGGEIPAGKDYNLSDNHYWTVRGIDFNNANITARVNFLGTANNLDEDLAGVSSDSLVILYRQDATHPWTLYPDQTKTNFGKVGYIDIMNLETGEYTLANTSEKVGLQEIKTGKGSIEIYPNPAKDRINLRFKNSHNETYDISVVDAAGKVLYKQTKTPDSSSSGIAIDLENIHSKFVIVSVDGVGMKVQMQ